MQMQFSKSRAMTVLMPTIAAILVATGLATSMANQPEPMETGIWLDRLESLLPDMLCDQDSYFQQCFEIDDDQCRSALSSTYGECLAIYRDHLPESITSSAEGAHWGQLIGSCAGTRFDLQMADLKIQNTRCNDATQW